MLKNRKSDDLFSGKELIAPLPMWDTSRPIMCVYKLYFDDRYYIGSTTSLRERLFKHLRALRLGHSTQLLTEAFIECSLIKVEILHIANDNEELRRLERQEVLMHIAHGNCLNKSMHFRILIGFNRSKKPVRAIGPNSVVVSFPSLKEAAEHANVGYSNMRVKVKHQRIVNGYVYKYVDENGNVEEKKTVRRKRNKGKGVIKCDLNNNVVEEFISITLAAESVCGKKDKIRNAISKNGTYKGFKWRHLY
jgi:hypothetical protein